jgi:hypothetical protein
VIPALLMGREGSTGFPGKNTTRVHGRALMEYPLIAATKSKYVDEVYVTTDSKEIKSIGLMYGARPIDRPPELCTAEALGEDVYVHGYNWIKENSKSKLELVVLLMANAPMVTGGLIDAGVEALRAHPEYDSAVSVSKYNMWSPLRARKIGEDGLLHPFVPFECFGEPEKLNCDRDSQGDVWFADFGVSVVRPACLENLKDGLLPQKWMGQKIYPLQQEGGLDVDYERDIAVVRHWINQHQEEFRV